MAKSNIQIVLNGDGVYQWRLLDERGNLVPIEPGTAPGVRMRKGRAELRRAVQAGLKFLYERQQAGAS